MATVAQDADHAANVLGGAVLEPDLRRALARLRLRMRAEQAEAPSRTRAIGDAIRRPRLPGQRLLRPLGAVAVAAMVIGALAFTPLGSLAQDALTVFQPKQIVPLPVSMSDLRSLPNLSDYGTMHSQQAPTPQREPDAAAAGAAAGMNVLVPAALPSGVPAAASYEVLPASSQSFTFSAAIAAKTAALHGTSLPPMPPSLDGSTLQSTIGPVVVAIYGGSVPLPSSGATGTTSGATVHCVLGGLRCSAHQAAGSTTSQSGPSSSGSSVSLPTLIVAQAPIPAITSTGATVAEIEDYLLKQPGVSPQLATAIRAIGDPTSTLPIPIPIEQAGSKTVTVQGVSGLAINDPEAGGGGIVWQKSGMIYGVAGFLPENELLAIANGLR